jgi:hypothetical protein
MIFSDDQIRQIADAISSALGPNAAAEQVVQLAGEIAGRLDLSMESGPAPDDKSPNLPSALPGKIVVSALGPANEIAVEKLRSFVNGRALRLIGVSVSKVDTLESIVAVIDCAEYKADLSRLKFELSELCGRHRMKAIIQDVNYYID